jgi:threonine aldolase
MGIEAIAGLEPRSLWAQDGRLDPVEVEEVIVEERATMLVLENTHTRAGGTVLTPELTAELAAAAQRHGAYVHLDGARLFNAAAAPALVALGTLVDRLADDHRHARELGTLLQGIPGLELEPAVIETNIVLVDVAATGLAPDEFLRLIAERGVLGLERDTSRVRFVTHRLIGDAEVARAAELVALAIPSHKPPAHSETTS